tara:strand:+ start:45 stop:536 length:492 start_codon:yes stop_codon:yes gene_type:complete
MQNNITPQQWAQNRADEKMFPKRLQEANNMAMKRGKNFGYQVRPKLYRGEIEYFKKNPNTPGYADFSSDSIVLNPFSTLPAEQLTHLVDNESIRLKMNKDQFVPPEFEITPEQKKFFKKTAYADNPVAMRQTILARIYSGDTESMKYTPEQNKELESYLSKDK